MSRLRRYILRRFVRVPSPSMIVALAALLVASTGAAIAAIPDAGGVIHACFTNRTGAVRVIDSEPPASQTCTSKETALNWSQTGPQGAPGPAGSVSATYVRVAIGSNGIATVQCDDPADFATGGGANIGDLGALRESRPTVDGFTDRPIGWFAVSTTQGPINAYVVCVDNSP